MMNSPDRPFEKLSNEEISFEIKEWEDIIDYNEKAISKNPTRRLNKFILQDALKVIKYLKDELEFRNENQN